MERPMTRVRSRRVGPLAFVPDMIDDIFDQSWSILYGSKTPDQTFGIPYTGFRQFDER